MITQALTIIVIVNTAVQFICNSHCKSGCLLLIAAAINILCWNTVNSFYKTLTETDKRPIRKCSNKFTLEVLIRNLKESENEDKEDVEAKDKDKDKEMNKMVLIKELNFKN